MPPKKVKASGIFFSSTYQPTVADALEVVMKCEDSSTQDEINDENLNDAVGTDSKVDALTVIARKRASEEADLPQGERSRVSSNDISRMQGEKAKKKQDKGKQRTINLSKHADGAITADWKLIVARRESLERSGSQ
jgi:hypothetical protein